MTNLPAFISANEPGRNVSESSHVQWFANVMLGNIATPHSFKGTPHFIAVLVMDIRPNRNHKSLRKYLSWGIIFNLKLFGTGADGRALHYGKSSFGPFSMNITLPYCGGYLHWVQDLLSTKGRASR